jgi:XRE family transcriptional regulator, regulator of sulfur utilization
LNFLKIVNSEESGSMPETLLAKVIGERIRLQRRSQGLSQEDLAQKAGLHPTYIGQLERGEKNATLESISKVARALSINLEDLVSLTSPNFPAGNETLRELVQELYRVTEADQKSILKIVKELLDWKLETTP